MRRKSDRSDLELLNDFRNGDVEAFDVFYRRFREVLMAYLRRRSGDPELAADLLAETFAVALLAATEPGSLPTEPGPWLFGVARNKLMDTHRRSLVDDRARRQLSMRPIELYDADIERINELTADSVVEDLIERLPTDQQAAIRARVLEERDYQEIAARLGCSDLVVRKRVSRGLSTLRAYLKETR